MNSLNKLFNKTFGFSGALAAQSYSKDTFEESTTVSDPTDGLSVSITTETKVIIKNYNQIIGLSSFT